MNCQRVWLLWGVIGSVLGEGWLEEYENAGKGLSKLNSWNSISMHKP